MSCDSYYGIGDKHQVCQDYALHGTIDGMEYAIVTDGCSSAKHSEIGAQILCHAAKYQLSLLYQTGAIYECSLETISLMLQESILKRISETRLSYPISIKALEATLFIAVKVVGAAYVFGWGDGVVITRYHVEDEIIQEVVDINYPDNAPFYLIYNTSNSSEIYKKERNEKNPQVELTQYSGYVNQDSPLSAPLKEIVNYRVDKPYYQEILIAQGWEKRLHSLTVCTDGICSFQDTDNKPIELIDIVPEVVDYKSTEGEFVKRRMFFLKRKVRKNNWTHSDDLGCATILI